MKKGIALIAALVLSVLLLGCEEAVTYATADDAKAALNGQGVITIDGDFRNQSGQRHPCEQRFCRIYAGDGADQRQMDDFCELRGVVLRQVRHGRTGEPPGGRQFPAPRWAFYDMDGNCLGYAQERVDANQDNAYIVYFLDPDFTPTACTLRRTARRCGTTAKTVLAEGDIDWSYSSDMCTITITPTGGKDVPIFAKIIRKLYHVC